MIRIVGTSLKTRGGISEVLKKICDVLDTEQVAYKAYPTHKDASYLVKVILFLYSTLLLIISLKKGDIIYLHVGDHVSMYRKNLILRLIRSINFRVVLHIHVPLRISDISIQQQKSLFRLIYKSDEVVVLSTLLENHLKRQFPQLSIRTVYNPARRSEQGANQKERWILWAGTLNDRKNYLMMINAFSAVHKEFPQWKLVFAGNGELDNAKMVTRKLGLTEKVSFLGWISDELKKQVFSKSSIYCLTSRAEGLPMSLLDASINSCAIISTKVGTLNELDISKEEMVFIGQNNSIQLADELKVLMLNDNELKKRMEGAYSLSKGLFSEEKFSKEILKLLHT